MNQLEEALDAIEKQLSAREKSIRFSLLNDYSRERIIIVDSIGILMAAISVMLI